MVPTSIFVSHLGIIDLVNKIKICTKVTKPTRIGRSKTIRWNQTVTTTVCNGICEWRESKSLENSTATLAQSNTARLLLLILVWKIFENFIQMCIFRNVNFFCFLFVLLFLNSTPPSSPLSVLSLSMCYYDYVIYYYDYSK